MERKGERYSQRYIREWRKDVGEWCTKSSEGSQFAFCTLCDECLSIGSGGLKDLKRHVQSSMHMNNTKVRTLCNAITSHFSPTPLDDNVSKAEILSSVLNTSCPSKYPTMHQSYLQKCLLIQRLQIQM